MSEPFRVEPDGKYFAIWWGPTLICTEWSTREVAQQHADILEALRQGDMMGARVAWLVFRDTRNRGRD